MTSTIPIIGPREAKLLFRYFVAVDRCLAGRFSLGYEPDEEHLTSLLTELLDHRGSLLHSLDYSLQQLNDALKSIDSLLQVELSISTNKYNHYQESKATKADLGLVLDYRDHIQPELSFCKAALFQAKRLYSDRDGVYRLSSVYDAYNETQHEALEEIQNDKSEMHHQDRCFYLLYNPSMRGFEALDQERIKHHLQRGDAGSIFDYTHGLHLYNELLGESSVQSFADIASLVCRIRDFTCKEDKNDSSKPSFENVIKDRNIRQSSFPRFLVFDFMLGHAGSTDSDFLQLVLTGGSKQAQENSNIRFLAPRYTLQIRVRAGRDPEHPVNPAGQQGGQPERR
ncbi:MAG: hypothetical protein WCJ40_20695 [Planctomycetota bacterium]